MKTLIKLLLGFILGYWMGNTSRDEFLYSMGTFFDWVGRVLYNLFS